MKLIRDDSTITQITQALLPSMTMNRHSARAICESFCISAHFSLLEAPKLLSSIMLIQALPIKWICKSALRSRKNAKLGFRPLSISAVQISTASEPSKTRVKCLELPPSLNIIKNVQRFNKCTFEKWVKAHSHLQSAESARLNSVWQSQTNIPARGSPVRASVGC